MDVEPSVLDEPAVVSPELTGTFEFVALRDDLPGLAPIEAVRPVRIVWSDDAAGSFADRQLGLSHDGHRWQVEPLVPGPGLDWPACMPPAPVEDVEERVDLAPVCAFEGTGRRYAAGGVTLDWLRGSVRGVVEERPAARLRLTGSEAAVSALIESLPAISLAVPRASLAREALAVSHGEKVPARHLGAPSIEGDPALGDGLAAILSHLLDVLLFWTDEFRAEGKPEAVHQARVATRRLRSALSLYKRACPALAPLGDEVKHCASMLGAVRDWDVFLDGTGASLAGATEGDVRLTPLLRAARRRREVVAEALLEYLGSAAFRRLELALGMASATRGWRPDDQPATTPFAAEILSKRLKHVRRGARGMDTLPVEALHELRKDCKRLRYAAEFFAPAFPGRSTKHFFRRLSELQEELGLLNDAAATAGLMAQLGRVGRGFAGGMVFGWAEAVAAPARARIKRSWRRFKHAEPFWL